MNNTYISDSVHENAKNILSMKLDNELRTTYNFDDTYSEVSELDEKLDSIRLKHIYTILTEISKGFDNSSLYYPFLEFGTNYTNGTRFGYNRANYKSLIKLIKKYFYKVFFEDNQEIEFIEENNQSEEDTLIIPFALTYINIYFEGIYSNIDDFFKYCKNYLRTEMFNSSTSQLTGKGIVIVENMCKYLLTRFGGLNNPVLAKENISIVLDKYFTDKLKEIPETNFKRIIMRELRKTFPHARHNTYYLRAFRNLSHGDFIPRKENNKTIIYKDISNTNGVQISYTIEELISVVNKLEFITDKDLTNFFEKLYSDSITKDDWKTTIFTRLCHITRDNETLIFLKENIKNYKNGSFEIKKCGLCDRTILDNLILMSYYAFVQYNVENYFKLIPYIKDDNRDWLNFDKLFLSREGNNPITTRIDNRDGTFETLMYSKYEYLKHALGHGRFRIYKNGIHASNETESVNMTFHASFLDSIEFITQPMFRRLIVLPPEFHNQNEKYLTSTLDRFYPLYEEYWTDCQKAYEEVLKNVQKEQEDTQTQEYVSGMHM